MTRVDVAIVGEIYVDHVFTGFADWPKPGEEVFTRQYVREIGGGGAITACALARLGHSVALVGAVGTDQISWITERLNLFGVASDHLAVSDQRTGVTVSVSTAQDRSFFTYVGENERLHALLETDAVRNLLAAARHVHFALPLTASVAGDLLPQLRAAGCTTSLDVGHHIAWLNDPKNHETCASIDYLLPNEREAEVLSGLDSAAYLEFTHTHRWRHGVVKLGARGAAMRSGQQSWRVPAPVVHAVDTTGAGDAFNAGFLDGLLAGQQAVVCLRRGCVCGALSTTAAGALGALPNQQQSQALSEETYGS